MLPRGPREILVSMLSAPVSSATRWDTCSFGLVPRFVLLTGLSARAMNNGMWPLRLV